MSAKSLKKNPWIFDSHAKLDELRLVAYHEFMKKHGPRMKEPYFWTAQSKAQYGMLKRNFLSAEEDRLFVRHHERLLLEYYRRFDPPMSSAVIGSAFQVYKRFYINNTAMEFDPMDILITCISMANKIEGKIVYWHEFKQNFENGERAVGVAMENEELIKQKLDFHLDTQNPFDLAKHMYRDIKMRSEVKDAEYLWPSVTQFLKKSLLTEALLLYPARQIALAGLLEAAGMCAADLSRYVVRVFLKDTPEDLPAFLVATRDIRKLVSAYKPSSDKAITQIRQKLDKIWDPLTNQRLKKYEDNVRKRVDELKETKPWTLDGIQRPPFSQEKADDPQYKVCFGR